jgi:hypothetical protein
VLQHSRAPSRSYAEGLSVCGECSALGAAWVPFGAAEIEEAEIGFLFPECVSVDSKRQLRVRATELLRDPANAFPRDQRQARERVSAVVKSQRSDSTALCLPAQPVP